MTGGGAPAEASLRPRLALVAVTLLWGSTFVVIHAGLDRLSPLMLVAGRFTLASLCFRLLFPRARLVRAAVPLALANFVALTLQTMGLETTLPSRSAFLTALSVILVPMLYPLFGKRLPGVRVWLAAGVALGGVYLLCRPLGSAWTRGDSLTVASAVVFAYYVVELGRVSRREPLGNLLLTQTVVTASAAALLAVATGSTRFSADPATIGALVYLGVLCTALTFTLMGWAQARVEPAEAAVIYTLEPVLASLISIAVGRESLTAALITGGALIVAGMFLTGGSGEAPDPS